MANKIIDTILLSRFYSKLKVVFALKKHSHYYTDIIDPPTIPSVGNGTVVIKQAGSVKGSFTLNQSGSTTVELTDNNTVYTHPSTHPASMITQDTTHRFVTDSEKTVWNAKASTNVATKTSNGLMSASDKALLEELKQFKADVLAGNTAVVVESTES